MITKHMPTNQELQQLNLLKAKVFLILDKGENSSPEKIEAAAKIMVKYRLLKSNLINLGMSFQESESLMS